MTKDDRNEFAKQQLEASRSIGADADLTAKALEVTRAADRHGYSYVWRWMGLPIIQMPTDVMVTQEIIWEARPEVIIETGVARGGSLVFSASMLALVGGSRVIGVDVDIRPHNRAAIEEHPMASMIELVEGSSVDGDVLACVRELVGGATRVMVVLDSDHTHDHVLAELHAYSDFVRSGQFLVVADTVVEAIPKQQHRPRRWGPGDNPATAVDAFLQTCSRFERDAYYNDKLLMSSSPGGYLRCLSDA